MIGTNINSTLLFREDLIKLLANEMHQVYVFAIDYNDVTRNKIKEIGGIPVDYILSRTGFNPFFDLYCMLKLSLSIRKIAPNLVFSFFSKPCIYGTWAAILAKVKNRYSMIEGLGHLFTEQKDGFNLKLYVLKRIQVYLYRISIPRLNAIIFLNEDDKNDLIDKNKIKAKEVFILGGIGVNIDKYKFTNPNVDKISFIFIARLLIEKGVYEYINAAKIVKAHYPETKFYLLGDIDEKNPGSLSKCELNKLKLDNIVIAPGYVTNVPCWIKKSSVFVLPSYYREGVPRSIQEAMSMGRAILTTNTPGCKDTVIHGINGYLIKRWDHVELAEKMIHLIEHPYKIIKMGENSHRLAIEKYNVNDVNKKLMIFLGVNGHEDENK